MRKKITNIIHKVSIITLVSALVMTSWPFQTKVVHAANTQIRQEINITDKYLGSGSGSYATSSEIIQIDTAQYTSPTYYFEIVASTTSAVSSNIYLKNATTSATVATINFSNSNTYTRYRSSSFTPTSGAQEYVVVIGNEAVQKGAIAARVIVLQNSASIATTETQIEIGNYETAKTNTATAALTSPKYWLYDSSKWDGSPTFSAEVTYKDYQVASSSTWTVAGTFTNGYTVSRGTSYVQIEAWGSGGGGGVLASGGGGGGGGGGYVRSTTTPAQGSTHTLVVGAGGISDSTTRNDSTYDTTTVVADGGVGSGGIAAGTGGTTNTGQVTFNGASGGLGLTTNDTSGGGGGAAGPGGAGEVGAAAGATANGAGGRGNNTTGGSSGTAGTYNTAVNGGSGGASSLGGGGGGGGGGLTSTAIGGAGGAPGGGGGGSETTGGAGAAGQIKIVETHGMVGIALEEDNGSFGSWTFKKMIVTDGTSTSTADRVRVSFTPTTGRNYRIVASTTASTASYDIYNAKIVVNQTSPTLLEPQYLLANTKLGSGTSLQNFHTLWDPAEWSTTNVYLHEADSVTAGTSDIKLQNTSGPVDVTNSTITDVIERERSSTMTMPVSSATLDVVATTNNSDLYSSSIIVQVSPTITVPDAPTSLSATGNYGRVNLTWVTPATGGSPITGYKLYRDTTTSPTTLIGTLGVVTSYWDGAITNGTLYYYRVVATNAIGDSAYSNESSATPTNSPASAQRASVRFGAPFMRFLGGRILFK